MSVAHSLIHALAEDLAVATTFGKADPAVEREELAAFSALLRELQVHLGAREDVVADHLARAVAEIEARARLMDADRGCTCAHERSAHNINGGCNGDETPAAEDECPCGGSSGSSSRGRTREFMLERVDGRSGSNQS